MSFFNRSLKFQLFILELCLIFLVVVTIIFIYYRTSKEIVLQNNKYTQDIISQIETNINTNLANINNSSFNVSINDDVKELVIADNQTSYDQYYAYRNIKEYCTRLESLYDDIKEIGLVSVDGEFYNLGYNGVRNAYISFLLKNMQSGSKAQYLGVLWDDYTSSDLVVFGTNVYEEQNNLDVIGYVITLVDISIFTRELHRELGDFYLVDDQNRIVISMDSSERGLHLVTNDHFEKIPEWKLNMPLHIAVQNTDKNITGHSHNIWLVYMVIICIMIFMVLITYIFNIKSTVKPLKNVSEFVSSISDGNLRLLKKRLHVKGPEEIRLIQVAINELLEEVNNLTHRLVSTTTHLYNIELAKKKAELDFLKGQVNPHFLYNTLGMVQGMATVKGDKEIKLITGSLAKIFRYSVKGNDQVPFAKELDIAKSYISIQKLRFNNRFDVEYDIEPHLLEMMVQKMILQPIIENAIIHGIEPISRPSLIKIIAREDTDGVRIIVKDNGTGMEEQVLSELRHKISITSNDISFEDHIGIMNVHMRLRYNYGEKSGMTIDSAQGEGTEVCLFFPTDKIV